MNWSDFLVLGVIIGFGIIGYNKGFIMSVFRLVSFFVAAVVSVKFYPLVAKILINTPIFDKIKVGIYKNLMLQQQTEGGAINTGMKVTAKSVVDNLKLPGFMKDMVSKHVVENVNKLVDLSQVMDKISDVLARMVIDILGLVVLYIVIRIGLIFLRFVLEGLSKLPVFKQIDKTGGFAMGAIEGLLTIYILFAVVMLFHSSPKFEGFFDAVENSYIAKFFYQNNFIVDWMFPKNRLL